MALTQSKASSFGFKQRNSLLHNNEIIDSSIVINIIINGKPQNETAAQAVTFLPTTLYADVSDVEPPEIEDLQKMDRYNRPLMPQPQPKDGDYQEIGGGRLKIDDGYRRPMMVQPSPAPAAA